MNNLSINISGIIFYVETDAHTALKTYLQDINQYFAKFESSREIIEDIENRIAEIFSTKLENTEVLSLQDIEELMMTMGSVTDFEEAEDDPLYESILDDEEALAQISTKTLQFKEDTQIGFNLPSESEFSQKSGKVRRKPRHKVYAQEEILEEASQEYEDKRLYRDTKRRFFGGVAAGIAHYLQTDPIWIRLCFVVLFTGLFFIDSAPQVALILYLVGWVFLPKNDSLEENPHIKKFYRDKDKGVLGGVSVGLARYFGVDDKVLRVIFVALTLLYGSGVLVYMFMWFCTPVAKSITEKMQLEGKPITLVNIETSVKRNLKKVNVDAESIWSKLALFPFRVLSFVIHQIQSRTQGVVHTTHKVLRIFLGIMSLLITLPLFFGISLAAFGANLGFINIDNQDISELVIRSIINFHWLVWGIYMVFAVPTLFVIFWGIRLLTGYNFSYRIVKVVMTSLWLIGFISLIFNGVLNAKNFKASGTYQTYQTQQASVDNFMIMANDTEGLLDNVRLKIIPYQEKEVKLVQYQKARGKNQEEAIGNAQYTVYKASFSDKSLQLPSHFGLKKNAKFRFQDIYLELYMPQGQKFVLAENMASILRNTLSPFGYTVSDLGTKKNVWQYNEEGELRCLTCSQKPKKSTILDTDKGIENISANGNIEIQLIQSDEKKIIIPEEYQDQISMKQTEKHLALEGLGNQGKVIIYSPTIKTITLAGACKLEAENFSEKYISVELLGASQCILHGQENIEKVSIQGNGAVYFEALSTVIKEANVQLIGASRAKIRVKDKISADLNGASQLFYKGNPSINKHIIGGSKVQKLD